MTRILVVDDEEGIRSFVAECLEGPGREIVQAADGDAGARHLEREAFDLLITDLRMPRRDGFALLAEVKKEQPDTEVIILTAHGTVADAVEAMRQGAFDFIEKPIKTPDALRLLVDRAIERRALRTLREVRNRPGRALPLSHGAPSMKPVVEALSKVAATSASVLLLGESGTGKELAARYVHEKSPRREHPFIAINCAALTETLLESELFGHERGAFTGADQQRRGRVELADGGTFFLDEVGELAPNLQAKLLRVLEDGAFERLGGSRTFRVDVRWIAATNRDLGAQIRAGAFREDLYHRLAVFPIELPPLRARTEDLVPLACALLGVIASELGRPGLTLDAGAEAALLRHTWPGNIRELKNMLERAAILSDGRVIGTEALWMDPVTQARAAKAEPVAETLAELEKRVVLQALAEVDGNRKAAAERLGIGLRTLYDKLKRYDEPE